MMEFLEILLSGASLTREQAKVSMRLLTSGECSASQVAAFLTALEIRGAKPEELLGFSEAMLELAIPVELGKRHVVDLCGTGGDGKDTFNISTVAAFVVAGAGQQVGKHGNYGFSSPVGSSNVLEELGVNLPRSGEEVLRDLEEAGIAFLHAPFFHPAVKRVAEIRRELRFRTVFNLLGPLTNPARPAGQLIGVCRSEHLHLYSEVMKERRGQFAVVHSLDGYDELSLTGTARMITRHGKLALEPRDFGTGPIAPPELLGGKTAGENADIARKILHGKGSEAQNRVVIANAAVALSVGARSGDFHDFTSLAEESLRSGAAARVLERLLENPS